MNSRIKTIPGLGALQKIGFITPSSNTALEPLTCLMLGQVSDRVSAHFARIPVHTVTLDQSAVGQFDVDKMVAAARQLADAGVQAILWNGTSGAWSGRGLEAEMALCDAITRATGIAASTSTLAQLAVLKKYGIERCALATPYVEGPAHQMAQTYTTAGHQVVNEAHLDLNQNQAFAMVPFESIRQLIVRADHPDAQCVIVGCTNLPASVVVDEMEHALGKPVFDSIAVTLWQALQMIGLERPLHGWGQLLRAHPVIQALDTLLADLLATTNASRTTIRLDIPALNLSVDDVYAEATAPGIDSLRLNSSLNQRSLATVLWMEEHLRPLIQEDCRNADVPPPKALMGVYGVQAQALGPLIWNDTVVGWISIHYVPGTRTWSATDKAALDRAVNQARTLLESAGWV